MMAVSINNETNITESCAQMTVQNFIATMLMTMGDDQLTTGQMNAYLFGQLADNVTVTVVPGSRKIVITAYRDDIAATALQLVKHLFTHDIAGMYFNVAVGELVDNSGVNLSMGIGYNANTHCCAGVAIVVRHV
jgi:hypothetical protein